MYNAADSIIRCLDSVINQTYAGKMEIIIVNDGSTDNSLAIVEEYAHKNSTAKINVFSQVNKGVSAARNFGLREAMGDYIALLDSDDEWLPEKLDTQIKYLEAIDRNFDFVCSLRNNDEIGFPYKLINGEYAEINVKKLLIRVVGQTSTALFKKKILLNTGFFDEDQSYSEDANYWMKISKENKMIILNKTLVITGGGKPAVGYSGLSANIEKMENGVQKNINEMLFLKRINILEYLIYKGFSKLKYLIRQLKYKKNV